MIKSKKIRLSSVDQFNDPYDCQYKLKGNYSSNEIRAYMRRLYGNNNNKLKGMLEIGRAKARTAAEEAIHKAFKEIRKTVGVFCTSESGDDILMFSHYGDNHKGCCIGFDFSKDERFHKIAKVHYQKNYPIVDFLREKDSDELIRKCFYVKADFWSYERECRLVEVRSAGKLLPFDSECLVSVTFGISALPDQISRVIEAATACNPSVSFFRAVPSLSEYRLAIKSLC